MNIFGEGKFITSQIQQVQKIHVAFYMVCCMWPCYEVRWMIHVQ